MYLWWVEWQRTLCSSMCKHALYLCAVVGHAGHQSPCVPPLPRLKRGAVPPRASFTTPWAGSLYGLRHGFWTMDSSPSKSGVTLLLQFLKDFILTCGQVSWFLFLLWVIKEMFTYWGYGANILTYTWVNVNIMSACGLLKIHCTSALILRKATLTRSKICAC